MKPGFETLLNLSKDTLNEFSVDRECENDCYDCDINCEECDSCDCDTSK